MPRPTNNSQAVNSTHPNDNCPITLTAALIGDKWTLLIARDLLHGVKRFSTLQESLGNVSPKTLSQRLKMLESEGLVTRSIYAEVPPRVEYSLTEKGASLADIIDAMRVFGEAHLLPDK